MNDCEHGYVVRSAQGANRFICKECNERFVGHPDVIRRKEELDKAIAQDEREREKTNGWKIQTHQEAAKAFAEAIFRK